MIQLAPQVRLLGLRPELLFGFWIIVEHCDAELITVTSIIDGRHMQNSLHYAGAAIDFVIPSWTDERAQQFVQQTRTLLGVDFDLLYDTTAGNQHFHLEWQPEHSYTRPLPRS